MFVFEDKRRARKHGSDMQEGGAEIVQLVLAMPLVIIFVFVLASFAFIGYSASTINAQINSVAWAVDVKEVLAADNQAQRDEVVRKTFAANTTSADMSRIQISNTSYDVDYLSESFDKLTYSYDKVTHFTGGTAFYYPNDDEPAFEIDKMVRDSNGGYLTFTVKYNIPLLVNFEFLDDLDFERTVTVGRVLNTRTDLA